MSQETRESSSQSVGLDRGTIIDPYPRYDYLRDRDPERLGVAVLVNVDKINELSGNVLQER